MDFYDRLAPHYDLIFADWDASMRRQGELLSRLIESRWPGSSRLLEVACGIGTQSIPLALRGYEVTASDLSQAAVETLIFRARRTLASGLADEGRGGLAKRITRGGDLGSIFAILKSLLLTGTAKVAATVATVAATSVVAATLELLQAA